MDFTRPERSHEPGTQRRFRERVEPSQAAPPEAGEETAQREEVVVLPFVPQAVVTEALPNTMFRLELPDGKEMIAYLSGKMRMYRIKVLVGDRVEVVIDPYGGKGRVVKRL